MERGAGVGGSKCEKKRIKPTGRPKQTKEWMQRKECARGGHGSLTKKMAGELW